ncbi:MAG: NADP-dependent 3-hydroxy acid dehydrogenase YdfG [Paracoccaceae bacterium]|jgi:NADP-dependent 3-hydroxy acid dehydrogenase YdfG
MSRTIFITGASGGIGAEVARKFLKEGWIVGMFARRVEALREVADGAENAVILPGDVTDLASIEAAIETLVARGAQLDVLFNNAGIFVPAAIFDEVPVEDWKRAVDINLTGMFLAARAAFGQMRHQSPQGGRIINNGSISAHAPREGAAAYTATKHGVTGLTRQISLDGRAFDIACGQIDIGNARTPLLEEIAAQADTPPPMMDVTDVADAVFHMATLPASANVQFMTIMATKMPFIGRG